MTCTIREEHCVRYVDDDLPEGHVVIDEYTPCHTVTPWDYYGMCHQREYSKVLKAANITCVLLENRRTNLHPMGTGPGGRVRMGDNMMPSTYKIAIKIEDQNAAVVALAAHKAAIAEWLKGPIGAPLPAACYD